MGKVAWIQSRTSGFEVTWPSHPQAAASDDHLAADEVRLRYAEQVDGAGRVVGSPNASERDEALHHVDVRRVESHLEHAATDVDLGGLSFVRLRETGPR